MKNLLYINEVAHGIGVEYHDHDFWQIIYYMTGSLTLYIGLDKHHIEAGTVVFIPPYTSHAETTRDGFQAAYLETKQIDAFPNIYFSLCDTDDRMLYSLIRNLYQINDKRPYHYRELTDALLSTIIQFAVSRQNTNYSSNPYINDLLQTIYAKVTDASFHLPEAIKKIPLSEDYLRCIFKKELGMTPHDYLIHLRMEKAQCMLAERSRQRVSVAQVAAACGFADPYYFSKVFKRQTGRSPLKWARKEVYHQ